MISTHQLCFNYAHSDKVFSFPDFYCGAGEGMLVLGNSGVGKTTLLSLLAGIAIASKGEIAIDGCKINSLRGPKLDRFRGQNIGLVFQQAHFINSISVEANLLIAQYLAGKSEDKFLVSSLLHHLGIAHHLQSKPGLMSQGEQQRLSIARALVNNPKVILADEPTSALDDDNCKVVIDLLKTQAEQTGAALIVVTHDQRLKVEFEKHLVL